MYNFLKFLSLPVKTARNHLESNEQLAHAGLERARPVAVPTAAVRLAHLDGLSVFDAVGEVFGESADELLQIYRRSQVAPGESADDAMDSLEKDPELKWAQANKSPAPISFTVPPPVIVP